MEDLTWLIREHLGEDVEVLERDSAACRSLDAALGLLRGGLRPEEVGEAVRRTGARVVHAHNVDADARRRALEAARAAGARVVLHLHNYRLVCAVGTCFTQRRGLHPLPRAQHAAGPAAELPRRLARRVGGLRGRVVAVAAAAVGEADAIVVPSAFALDRLLTLGAPLGQARVLGSVQRTFADRSAAADGEFVLAAGRLTPRRASRTWSRPAPAPGSRS